jgi:hypothetical protein
MPEQPRLIYAEPGKPVYHVLTMIWALVCRRLEGFPNITSTQLFEELCIQVPGRFHPKRAVSLAKQVKVWRQDARGRGVVIGRLKYRHFSKKPRGRGLGPQSCTAHRAEMLQWLEEYPDQTAVEFLAEFPRRATRDSIAAPSAHAKASCAGLTPTNHSTIDLRNERTDTRCHRRCRRTILPFKFITASEPGTPPGASRCESPLR